MNFMLLVFWCMSILVSYDPAGAFSYQSAMVGVYVLMGALGKDVKNR